MQNYFVSPFFTTSSQAADGCSDTWTGEAGSRIGASDGLLTNPSNAEPPAEPISRRKWKSLWGWVDASPEPPSSSAKAQPPSLPSNLDHVVVCLQTRASRRRRSDKLSSRSIPSVPLSRILLQNWSVLPEFLSLFCCPLSLLIFLKKSLDVGEFF